VVSTVTRHSADGRPSDPQRRAFSDAAASIWNSLWRSTMPHSTVALNDV